jgi:hypothetical protein
MDSRKCLQMTRVTRIWSSQLLAMVATEGAIGHKTFLEKTLEKQQFKARASSVNSKVNNEIDEQL